MTFDLGTTLSQQFRDAIAGRLGLRFDDGRLDFLGDVLRRRAEAQGVSAERYADAFAAGATETGALADDLTVGETYFFRDGDQFRALGEMVLPELMQQVPPRPVNILSAGCSSGEEPYSIAMAAAAAGAQASIRAVDLNPVALRKAALGRYGAWSLRETPHDMRRRWFAAQGRDMLLAPDIRQAVRFEARNLAEPNGDVWRPQAYDIIFCRNVIMYFTPEVQREVVARIADSLVPGGYLFLGHAETLRGLSEAFSLIQTHGTFYYERKSRIPARKTRGPAAPMPLPHSPAIDQVPDASWYEAIASASRRIEALSRPKPGIALEPAVPAWDIKAVFDLLRQERFTEALDLADRAPPELADDPALRLLQAVLLVQDGRLDAAAIRAKALLSTGTFAPEANHVLALCHEGSGQNAAAMRGYDQAAELDPSFAMPRLRGGIVARRAGQLDAALVRLDAAAELLGDEDAFRLLLFGGGFARGALSRLCAAELKACEAAS